MFILFLFWFETFHTTCGSVYIYMRMFWSVFFAAFSQYNNFRLLLSVLAVLCKVLGALLIMDMFLPPSILIAFLIIAYLPSQVFHGHLDMWNGNAGTGWHVINGAATISFFSKLLWTKHKWLHFHTQFCMNLQWSFGQTSQTQYIWNKFVSLWCHCCTQCKNYFGDLIVTQMLKTQ